MNAPRAFRATELAKEFVRQGHEVFLFAKLGSYDYVEFEKITGVKVMPLGKTFFSTLNSDGESRNHLIDRVLKKLLNYLFEFPDIELSFLIPGVLKRIKNADAVISIAIPHTLHWGTALTKFIYPNIFPKKWIADCGDPYMGNHFKKYPFYFNFIEKFFCKQADYITVPLEDAKKAYFPEFRHKIKVIPQGFNFNEVELPSYKKNDVPTFLYAGIFYEKIRDPREFLNFLTKIKKNYIFKVFTKNRSLLQEYENLLGDRLQIYNYIPRDELLVEMRNSDFLINFSNNITSQSPSKLIDYLIADRPILSITNEMDFTIINDFLMRDYSKRLIITNPEQYRIENIVSKFVQLIKN